MKFTNRNYLLSTAMLFLAVCILLPLLGRSITKTEVKLSDLGANVQTKMLEVKCASGYSKLSDELSNIYLLQSKKTKNAEFPSKFSLSLRNEIEFYGFTYSIFDAPKSGQPEIKCSKNPESPKNVIFVSKDINNIVQMFISALIFNEEEVAKAQLKITENDYNQFKINELKLCIDVQCGLNDGIEELKSFSYEDSEGIKFSRDYSDSRMFDQALNNLRNITSESDDTLNLTDSELVQMLTQARIIAYTKMQEKLP